MICNIIIHNICVIYIYICIHIYIIYIIYAYIFAGKHDNWSYNKHSRKITLGKNSVRSGMIMQV